LNQNVYYTRLGENLAKKKYLSKEVISRNLETIGKIIKDCQTYLLSKKHPTLISRIEIIATESLRSAKNNSEFTHDVKKKFGLDVRILSEQEEAFYTYYSNKFPKNIPVLDIGGGSTELVFPLKTTTLKNDLSTRLSISTHSFPVGSVYLKDLCKKNFIDFPNIEIFLEHNFQILKEIIHTQAFNDNLKKNEMIIGVGGTFFNIAKFHVRKENINFKKMEGLVISIDDFKRILNEICNSPFSFFKEDGSSDVLPFGVTIVLYLLPKLQVKKIIISCKGVRHGYAESILTSLNEKS